MMVRVRVDDGMARKFLFISMDDITDRSSGRKAVIVRKHVWIPLQ
jgi:hypothetical protein